MNIPAGKILKRVSHLDPTIFSECGQFCKVHMKGGQGMWRAEKGQLSVPYVGLAGAFQPKSEQEGRLKMQKGTAGFWPESKVISFTACSTLTGSKCSLLAWPSMIPWEIAYNQKIGYWSFGSLQELGHLQLTSKPRSMVDLSIYNFPRL